MDSAPLIRTNENLMGEAQSTFQAEFQRRLGPSIYAPVLAQESMLREYFRVLVKRRWVVFTTVAVIFGITAITTMRATRIYEASGSIAINKPESFLNFKDSGGGDASDSDNTDVDTEVRILRSDLLALQVIKQLNLDRTPESGEQGMPSDGSLGLTTDELDPDSSATSSLVAGFKNSLNVSSVPGTRIIDIQYRSPDKELAARVVNTLITTYEEQNFKTKFESTQRTSDWLSQQLADLQMKVESSQEKLVEYQKEHGILGIDEKQNIITSKLDELNRELTTAESDRMEKEALYRLVQTPDLGTALAAVSGEPDNQAPSASSTSALLEKLREQQADVKVQMAQLSTQFGPSYPKVTQLNNQLTEIDAQIQLEMKKVIDRVRGEYMAAAQRESMLNDAMEKQKQEANQLNESAIEYNLLKRDVDANRTLYEGLLEKLKEAGVTEGLRSNNFRTVDVARVPTAPAEPNVPRNLAFGLALGLTTGVGLGFLLEGIDNTVRTPEQAQAISSLPSLGMIPLGTRISTESGAKRLAASLTDSLITAQSNEAVELVTVTRPQSQMAESYRALRTSLLLTSLGAPPKVILITSALPQEGKTTTSLNTSVVLAQKGSRVLLIDADMRRPSVHKTLGMGPKTGLSNVLTGSATLQQAIVRYTEVPNLYVLPAGTPPPNPAELLASAHMGEVLTDLRSQYDHIVIDSPPTLSVTDAVILGTRVDTVVLVIRSGQTTKQALRRARDLLLRVNARISGVLLNAADLSSPDYYYYYEYQGKYGSRYYQTDEAFEDEQTTGDEEVRRKATSTSA
jgi:exopolysaccharide transport family protein